MWNRLTEDKWLIAIDKLNLSLFYQPNYLNSIAQVYKLEVSYLSFESKSKTIALMGFLSDRKRNIVLPEGFSYSPFYIQKNLSESLYISIITSLIKTLKEDFKNIKIKLPSYIKDIRPFSWENFSVDVRYTHVKLDNSPPDASILKSLGKEFNNDYTFKVEDLNQANLMLNLEFLKTLKFSTKKIGQHDVLLKKWAEFGYLKAFSLYRNNSLVCSNLVLVDFKSLKAYTILLNNVDKENKNAHSVLYQHIITYCNENGLQTIDFCGANFKSISEFKSRFNTDLEMYFLVNYEPLQASIKSTYKSMISILTS